MANYYEDYDYDEEYDNQEEEEEQTEPDSKMINYYPYSGGQNPKHSPGSDSQTLSYLKQGFDLEYPRATDFYKRVVSWLQRELTKPGKEVILALVPGHKEDPNPDGLVHKLARKLLDSCLQQEKPVPFKEQLLLIRTRTVRKSATSQGPRSKATHWGTIEVSPNSPDCSGKVVVILDDIWTSGSTIQVCADVIRSKYPGVKDIKLFVIGRTVSCS